MSAAVSFECSNLDATLIRKITQRAYSELRLPKHQTVIDTEMDLTACHCNGCPLDLEKLHEADGLTFAHDVYGILRHIDRDTGALTDCFTPRCARRV